MQAGIIFGILAGMLWGFMFLAPEILDGYSPLWISCARYLLYGIISFMGIAPFARKILRKLSVYPLLVLFRLALIGNIFYYILTATAVQLIGIAPTSLIVGLVPVTAAVFGRTKDSIPLKSLAGPLVLIALGIFCINTDIFTQLHHTGTAEKIAGLLCAVGALAAWTWYAIDNARYLKSTSLFSSNEWSLLFGAVTGLLAAGMCLFLWLLPVQVINSGTAPGFPVFLGVCFILAFGGSWLGNLCWNAASKRLPFTLTGQMIIFETIFALIYGFIYTQRLPRMLEITAVIFLISGVVWSIRKHR